MVIQPDTFTDGSLRLWRRSKAPIQPVLEFNDSVDPFSHSIIVAVSSCSHTRPDLIFAQEPPVRLTRILCSTVAVMYQPTHSNLASLFDGLVKSTANALMCQRITEVVAYNATRIEVGDQCEIVKTVFCLDIRNVTDPDLIRPVNFYPGQQVFAAPGSCECCPPVAALGGNEQSLLAATSQTICRAR